MPFDNAPERNLGLTIAARMIAHFENGKRWKRGWGDGKATCMLGALGIVMYGDRNYFRFASASAAKDAVELLSRAVVQCGGVAGVHGHHCAIMDFNDGQIERGYVEGILPVLQAMHALELAEMTKGALEEIELQTA